MTGRLPDAAFSPDEGRVPEEAKRDAEVAAFVALHAGVKKADLESASGREEAITGVQALAINRRVEVLNFIIIIYSLFHD